MEFEVNGWNNFCRVFEFPDNFPSDYCFGGGHDVMFKMVDWFNPVPGIPQPGISKEQWELEVGPIEDKKINLGDLKNQLLPWLKEKNYVVRGKTYLILFNFGASLVFTKDSI